MASRFVQVSNPKGDLEVVEREIPEPGDNKYVLRFKLAVFVTVTPL